jgi:hypothetical protein
MVIDANMYWFPEELFTDEEALSRFVAEAPRAFDTNVYLTEKDGLRQVIVEKPAGFPSLNYAQGDYVLETMLADMDEAGVDKAVLKVPGCRSRRAGSSTTAWPTMRAAPAAVLSPLPWFLPSVAPRSMPSLTAVWARRASPASNSARTMGITTSTT